ncbi:MAG: ABC transporter ATP-binding protein [Acidobacteria bacterium]|nr:ABC transporter ATP-binding protein [Acidobacteriota bacterium]
MSSPAIIVEGLGKRYSIGPRVIRATTLREALTNSVRHHLGKFRRPLGEGAHVASHADAEFWALRDVSFEVPRGQVLGIIGRNGSGKSTLLKILSRITPPTEGEAAIVGRVGSLLEIGTGFHPELTGRENIFLSGTILGMRQSEINQRFDEIVDFSGVERFIDTPVKHHSSGMYLRLAFAVAAHLRTEVLLVDEVLAVGDAAFQKRCIDKMSDIAREGRTVLFVSHNLGAVSRLCDSGLLLDAGRLAAQGPIGMVVASYGRLVAARDEEAATSRREWVAVRDLQVAPAGSPIDPSTPLTFSFRLEVRKAYWNVFVQLGLTTPEGMNLVLDAVDSERRPELARTGRYDVEIALPALWLRPRGYTSRVKVIAHPESGPTERFYSEWVDIAVEGGQQVESVSDRILAPRADWRVQAVVD